MSQHPTPSDLAAYPGPAPRTLASLTEAEALHVAKLVMPYRTFCAATKEDEYWHFCFADRDKSSEGEWAGVSVDYCRFGISGGRDTGSGGYEIDQCDVVRAADHLRAQGITLDLD